MDGPDEWRWQVNELGAATQAVKAHPGPALRPCIKCGKKPIHGKTEKARFCANCIGQNHAHGSAKRQTPKKWVPTETIDKAIREHYLKRVTNGGSPRSLPTLQKIGSRFGWPKYAIQQRARSLGVTRAKEEPWSEAELEFLEGLTYLTPERIRERFAKAGYKRSAAAINLQIKRKHLRSPHGFYPAVRLAELIGVDAHVVVRWINQGKLKARPRGTDCKHDQWLIRDEWVRDFVISNQTAFDIRKVNQVWFLKMLLESASLANQTALSCSCQHRLIDGRKFLAADPDCSKHGLPVEVSRYTARRSTGEIFR